MNFLATLLALGLTPLVFDLGCVDPILAPKLTCWLTATGLTALWLRPRPLSFAAVACLLWLSWSLLSAGLHSTPWHHVALVQTTVGILWLMGSSVAPKTAENILLTSWGLTVAYSWAQRLHLDPFAWSHPGLSQLRTIAGLGNPNFLAMYLACLLPLVASRSLGLALLGWVSVVLTATRGAQLALFVVGIVWVIVRRQAGLKVALAAALAGLSWWGCQSWLALGSDKGALLPSARMESVSIRFILWKSALQQGMAHPILGVGPGNFGFEYLRIRPLEPESTRALQRCPEDPHSQPLLLLSEQGFPGLLLWSIWMASCLWNLRRAHPTSALCLSVLLINGLTNAIPLTLWPLLFHWTTLTLPPESAPPRWRWWGIPLALGLAGVGLSGWIFQRALWWEDEYRIWARNSREARGYQEIIRLRRANLDRAARCCPPWFYAQQASYEFQFWLEVLTVDGGPEQQRQAEHWALRRVQLQPSNPYAWMSLAQLKERQARWAEAAELWQQIQQQDPCNPAVLFWLARARYHSGRPDDALSALGQSIEINSNNNQVYQLQAQIMIDRGRTWEGYWGWVEGSAYR